MVPCRVDISQSQILECYKFSLNKDQTLDLAIYYTLNNKYLVTAHQVDVSKQSRRYDCGHDFWHSVFTVTTRMSMFIAPSLHFTVVQTSEQIFPGFRDIHLD